MKIALFIPTASVENDQPSPWLRQILDAAIEYYHSKINDDISFIVSGRWKDATSRFLITEAEAARNYILSKLPDALVLKEDLAVETGGNFAFSKPFLDYLHPELVVIFMAKVREGRARYFASKIFGPQYNYEFNLVEEAISQNLRAIAKEPKALAMFKKLFDSLADGDDQGARQILLYKTPYYYRGIIDDRKFFDEYWDGGFDDFTEKRLSIDNK